MFHPVPETYDMLFISHLASIKYDQMGEKKSVSESQTFYTTIFWGFVGQDITCKNLIDFPSWTTAAHKKMCAFLCLAAGWPERT